ncbi:unnamed protein product [Cuscuta europaea]|nr:unnamed protein product [Cuscuta europaea]
MGTAASGHSVKKQTLQTLTVVSLADIQRPLQQKQRSTEAAAAASVLDGAAAPKKGGLKLDILNHLDLLSEAELKDINHDRVFINRLQRDENRVRTIQSAAGGGGAATVISGANYGSGEYFGRVGLGSDPGKGMYLILDTGSDLSWVQCKPCSRCYKQADPIFNSNNSKSFHPVFCGQPSCDNINDFALHCQKNTKMKCQYNITYGDDSETVGDLANDTLTLMGKTSSYIPEFIFGCSRSSKGLFVGSAGLLGLGRGKSSLPAQLAATQRPGFSRSSTFSYCLSADGSSDAQAASSIDFGDYGSAIKPNFTSLLRNRWAKRMENFYFIELEGVSVGGYRVAGIKPSMFKPTDQGGLIIDSGTTVTRLYKPAYDALCNRCNYGRKGRTEGWDPRGQTSGK